MQRPGEGAATTSPSENPGPAQRATDSTSPGTLDTTSPAIADPTGGVTGGTVSGGGRASGATGSSTGEGGAADPSRAAYGANMQDCMSVWDPTTHMTKQEWRATCERTTTRR